MLKVNLCYNDKCQEVPLTLCTSHSIKDEEEVMNEGGGSVRLTPKDFEWLCYVGRGAFGKVVQVVLLACVIVGYVRILE